MKKLLTILYLIFSSTLCFASLPGDVQLSRRWLNGAQGIEPVFIPEPATTAFWIYDVPNRTLAFKQLGTGFDCSTAFCNVTGGTGPAGATGPAGSNGASAYEIALANGFIGSQAAWLASLVSTVPGPKGATGANGTNATVTAVVGTTLKTSVFRTYKNAAVASGVAVFQLTDDGLSSGNPLYTEVFTDSVSVIVNDATASYQMSWIFSNANKTLTVTANKLTTANILTGLLGQSAANGAVVRLVVEGR